MRRSNPLRRFGQNVGVLAVLLLALAGWEQGVKLFEIKRYLLPAPSEIAGAFVTSGEFLAGHALATVQTVVLGFLIALGLAVVLALAMLLSPFFARLMQPVIVVSQTLPTVITAPLLLIWVGFNMTTKVIAAVLNAFFPMLVALYDGLRSPDGEQVELLQAAGASAWQVFWKLRFPAALPSLFSGMKVASISAVTGTVVGEYIVGKSGLGHYARAMAGQLETADVFAGVILVSAVGVLFYLTIALLERLVMPWYFIHKQ